MNLKITKEIINNKERTQNCRNEYKDDKFQNFKQF